MLLVYIFTLTVCRKFDFAQKFLFRLRRTTTQVCFKSLYLFLCIVLKSDLGEMDDMYDSAWSRVLEVFEYALAFWCLRWSVILMVLWRISDIGEKTLAPCFITACMVNISSPFCWRRFISGTRNIRVIWKMD